MDDSRTLYCGNLSSRVTEELLYELFLQAGPLDDIILPKDSSGEQKSFAFIIFKHQCSVDFAIRIFQHTALFERKLDLKPRERGPPASRQQTNTFPILPSLPNPGFHNQMPYPIQFYPQPPFPPGAGAMVMTLQAGSSNFPQHGQHLERNRCNFHRKFQEDGSYQDDDFRHFEQRNERREDKRFKPYRSDSDLGKTHSQYNDSREHSHYRHHMNHEEPRRNDQRERSKHHDDSRRSDNRERSTYYHNDQRRNNQKGKANYHHHR